MLLRWQPWARLNWT